MTLVFVTYVMYITGAIVLGFLFFFFMNIFMDWFKNWVNKLSRS